jgi:peroxiredoxin
LVQLAGWQERFAELGVNVAGMTYDDQSVLAKFHADNELGYHMLQDLDVKHVNAYGVRNMSYEPGDGGYGIPEPGILYIGPDGVVRAKFAVPGYRSRPPFEAVYEVVSEVVSSQAP